MRIARIVVYYVHGEHIHAYPSIVHMMGMDSEGKKAIDFFRKKTPAIPLKSQKKRRDSRGISSVASDIEASTG